MKTTFRELTLEIPDTVYEPAEDSFMLAEAAGNLKKNGSVLEIGCGSGIAGLCAARYANCEVLAIDISSDAVRCASNNAKLNKLKNMNFEQSDLFSNVPKKKFDAILFNPPYLPTEYKDKLNGPLNHAFDGGKDGRLVLDVFLDKFDPYLKKGGCLLLVQSDLNGPTKTKRKLKALGYTVEVALRQAFFFEVVYIYKATKIK
ncbi:methyltransferase [Candidatus Micrarchaeota archaeon]|nr:methyltransferase [Candidatus Micrarchaeota archaeon]